MFLTQAALVYADNYFFSEECFLVHIHLNKGMLSSFKPNIYLTREEIVTRMQVAPWKADLYLEGERSSGNRQSSTGTFKSYLVFEWSRRTRMWLI